MRDEVLQAIPAELQAEARVLMTRPTGCPALALVTSADEAVDAFRAGAVEVLIWPRDREHLVERITTARERYRQRVHRITCVAAVRASPDWVEVSDADGRLMETSRGFERHSGYRRDEALGRTPRELFRVPVHGPKFWRTLEAEAHSQGWSGSLVSRRRDGSCAINEAIVAPVHHGDDLVGMYCIKRTVTGLTGGLLDYISARVSEPWGIFMGGVLMEHSRELEAVLGPVRRAATTVFDVGLHRYAEIPVGESNTTPMRRNGLVYEMARHGMKLGDRPAQLLVFRDITHEAVRADTLQEAMISMQAARDLALSADRAKSAFLTHMSHELRTPLNVIIGYCELLLEELNDPSAASDLDAILTAGRHLLGLVDELLDLARVESGQIAICEEPVEITALMGEVVHTLRDRAASREKVLRIVCQEPRIVVTDRHRLRQILVNLVSNAIKYANPGEIRLGVEDEHLFVEDDGPGLSKAQLDQIFQAFTQLHGKHDGVGLGLAISQRLATALGASLTAHSDGSSWTRFHVELTG